MNNAAFKLEKYIFDQANLNLSNLKAETTFNIDFIPSGEFYVDKDKYVLTFLFTAKDAESNAEIAFVRCIATFLFRDMNADKEIPEYFYTNSIAILFPYIRAFVSTLTLQANVVPIVLPILNLSDLKDTLKAHTKRI